MNREQRIVLIVYCLLLAYCCVWIPWCWNRSSLEHGSPYTRIGYGWVWAGPYLAPAVTYNPPKTGQPGLEILGEVDLRPNEYDSSASPDFPLIALRIMVATALSAAVLLASGIKTSPAYTAGKTPPST